MESHQARDAAEGFGADAERYDRTRPRYPQELIDAVVAASPGTEVLDVGIGTGIVARPLVAAGCQVLGVEVDERMVELARSFGVPTDVAKFEDWEPGGRTFDAVVAGQTWHWIDPVVGAGKAADVLREHGLLALFWNVMQPPPDVAEVFADVYRQVLPENAGAASAMSPPQGGLGPYETMLAKASEGIAAAGGFTAPERREFPWSRTYSRAEWLEQVPTFGGFSSASPETQTALLAGMAAAVDRAGGSFEMSYTAVLLTATRRSAQSG